MGATVAPVVRRPNPTAVGIAIWLASEVMFFGGLFAAYFAIRAANDDWPPQGIHLDTVRAGLFTLVLVASSFTLHAAERATADRPARSWTLATLALGVIFLANQAAEWASNDFSVLDERLRRHVLRARRASTACTSPSASCSWPSSGSATRTRPRRSPACARPPPGTGTSSTSCGSASSPPSS